MEYLKKEELYKNRGYAKCISCGYHAMVDNYKSIFSYTWKPALAYCLVNIIALSITNGFSIPVDTTGWVIWGVMLAAMILSQYYMLAHIVNIFTKVGKLTVFKRLLIMFLWGLLINIILMVFLYATILLSNNQEYGSEIIIIVSSVLAVILFVLGIPFGYLTVKYVTDDEKHFHNVVRHNYYKGFTHWGLIFVTLILSVFFVAAASFVVALPLYILIIAKVMSETGILLGDENGIPSYFPYIFSVTIALISVILMYLNAFVFATMYYTYGSIEQRENERIGFMENSMKS